MTAGDSGAKSPGLASNYVYHPRRGYLGPSCHDCQFCLRAIFIDLPSGCQFVTWLGSLTRSYKEMKKGQTQTQQTGVRSLSWSGSNAITWNLWGFVMYSTGRGISSHLNRGCADVVSVCEPLGGRSCSCQILHTLVNHLSTLVLGSEDGFAIPSLCHMGKAVPNFSWM